MNLYVAFLRGINVGGHSLIKMAKLKDSLIEVGFGSVKTYIQSGNVFFQSTVTDTEQLNEIISSTINNTFNLSVIVVVFSASDWKEIISSAPTWWGKNSAWKHNLLIFTEPYDTSAALKEIGTLKPGIEKLASGHGVIYQSVSWEYFGRSRSGKLASLPIYKKMTVRNYNTASKLVGLLD